jgi:hypothetical protein
MNGSVVCARRIGRSLPTFGLLRTFDPCVVSGRLGFWRRSREEHDMPIRTVDEERRSGIRWLTIGLVVLPDARFVVADPDDELGGRPR